MKRYLTTGLSTLRQEVVLSESLNEGWQIAVKTGWLGQGQPCLTGTHPIFYSRVIRSRGDNEAQ